MIFLIESIVACLVFTAIIIPSVVKNPLAWVSDYPPAIQDRCKELGLIPKEQKRKPAGFLLRKLIAALVVVILMSFVLVYVNGASGFWQGFGLFYGLWAVVVWYDALVLDCLWVCHSKKAMIPGTEDMVDSYHDYWFHIRMSMVGMLLGIPVSLLTGLGVMILS